MNIKQNGFVEKKEIFVEKNRLYLKDNIVYVTNVGEDTETKAIAMKKAYFELISDIEGKVNVFIDLSLSQKPSPKVRGIWKELTEHEKTGRIAFLVINPVLRMLASFVAGVSKNKDMRFFETKEKAVAWLKE